MKVAMNMKDPFHEAKEALNIARREYTSVSSLSVMAANATNQACENSIRSLWKVATGKPFPHDKFKPFHKPALDVEKLGIKKYYSEQSQHFLDKLTGYALDDARFEDTQAFIDHTKPKSTCRGVELINGTERFINESEQLSHNDDVLNRIRNFYSKVDRG